MIYPLIYGLLCVLLAANNSHRIKAGKKINHALNGSLHIVAAILIGWFIGWRYGVATLFVARLVFDTCLNWFRGLPPDHIPLKPASWVDRQEKKLFRGNIWLAKGVYLVIIIALLWK